ncbi:MAG: DUF881 domain-containing protein [Actinobacteria bacterium]|nr:DUF881 domain-containing protein [Actinomycetota bacterium]
MTAYLAQHRSEPAAAKTHSALVARVRSAESQGNRLESSAQSLARRVDELRNNALPASGPLRSAVARDQAQAGQLAVKGPGLRVSLADPAAPSATPSPGRKGAVPIGAVQVLTDQDLRSVVNQLWSEGAEAIAVNGVRLTPTSAIRFAGEAVLVDFRPIASPYVIEAIGDAEKLDTDFAASPVASRYETLAGAKGISFSVAEQKTLSLPAAVPLQLQYATQPSTPPSPSTANSPSAARPS